MKSRRGAGESAIAKSRRADGMRRLERQLVRYGWWRGSAGHRKADQLAGQSSRVTSQHRRRQVGEGTVGEGWERTRPRGRGERPAKGKKVDNTRMLSR